MDFGFLFWLFLIGIIIASLQDLKRREVDNWLNLFLLVSSFVFILFGAILNRDVEIIFRLGFLFLIMFGVINLFYYGRVFAGGDAKLLVAMTVFFMSGSFYGSLINVGIFCFFLMVSGSFYGLIYSGVLYFKNWSDVNKEIKKGFDNLWVRVVIFCSVILMLFGFIHFLFFLVGALLFVFPFLYIFAKGLENVSMIREVSGKELREGDWLVEDVRVGKNVIKADWDGLSLKDIELLKGKKRVLIKEGLPFVPAFLIAFLGYVFLKDWLLGLFFV